MTYLFNLIQNIDSNNSTNYKIEVLEKFFSELDKNENLRNYMNIIKIVYDTNINFYITKEQLELNKSNESEISPEDFFAILENLSKRIYKKNEIEQIYNTFDEHSKFIFEKSIDRSLFNGVSNKILEKAYYNVFKSHLYPTFPYMRCSLQDKLKHIKYPAISQLKSDGMFCNLILESCGDINLYSRQGKKFDINSDSILITKFKNDLKELIGNDIIIMGELILKDENQVLNRKIGNGLLTSLSKMNSTIDTMNKSNSKTKDKKITERLKEWEDTMIKSHFIVWDILSYNEWTNQTNDISDYIERFKFLSDLVNSCNFIHITESKIVDNYNEALSHFQELYSRGEEGTILKNFNMKFKNGTSNDQIKFKAVKQCELKIIGFSYGSGQFSQGIGSFDCISEDGKLRVNISGMDRNMRGLELVDEKDVAKGLKVIDGFDFEQYLNKIITVEFNEVIKAKDKDEYSLFLPRIVEIREDKNISDTLNYILKL